MSDQQGSHFWYMTVMTTGSKMRQFDGHIDPPRGMSRLDAFYEIRKGLDAQYPEIVGGVVLAFDIQPNKL